VETELSHNRHHQRAVHQRTAPSTAANYLTYTLLVLVSQTPPGRRATQNFEVKQTPQMLGFPSMAAMAGGIVSTVDAAS